MLNSIGAAEYPHGTSIKVADRHRPLMKNRPAHDIFIILKTHLIHSVLYMV